MGGSDTVGRSAASGEEKMGLLHDISSTSSASSDSDHDDTVSLTDMDSRFTKNRTWSAIRDAPAILLRHLPLKHRFLLFFVPSFLQGRHYRDQIRPAKLQPTAYLDGMRGLASLFVYFCHYSYQAFQIAEGWGCDGGNYYILKLPILRLWYQGPAAVCVFFVISGYALSYRPLKLARNHSLHDFASTMGSLVFRRWTRLFVPPIVSTFIVFCLIRCGVYELTRDFAMDTTYHKNVVEPHYPRLDSFTEQLCDWFWNMFRFIHVWDWLPQGGRTEYDVHLWTIPMEYRCSLYLFLVMIGTARLRTRFRMLTVLAVTWFTYRSSRWEFTLFLAGMILAELDIIRDAHAPTPPALPIRKEKTDVADEFAPRGAGRFSGLLTVFWTLMCVVALYLLSQPDGLGEITPGWIWLTEHIPEWWGEEDFRYWQGAGAILLVAATARSRVFQSFFNTAVVQYFGKISYAIYLMHGPVMHAIGYHWEKWAYTITGVEGSNYNAGFFLGACLCVPSVIICADIFWRAVDIPTVKFAKWLEGSMVQK